MNNYYLKYLKYKNKYQKLTTNKMTGGQVYNDDGSNKNLLKINNVSKLQTVQSVKQSPLDSGKGDLSVKKNLLLCELLSYKGVNERNWDLIRVILDENVVRTLADGTQIIGLENNMKFIQETSYPSGNIKLNHIISNLDLVIGLLSHIP